MVEAQGGAAQSPQKDDQPKIGDPDREAALKERLIDAYESKAPKQEFGWYNK